MPAAPSGHRKPAKQARKRRRVKVAKLRELALAELPAEPVAVDPADVVQYAIGRFNELATIARVKFEELPEDEMFRDTIAGPVPNEWLRLEADSLERAVRISLGALRVDLAERDTASRELQSEAFAAVVARVLDNVPLNQKQKAAVRRALPAAIESVAGSTLKAVA